MIKHAKHKKLTLHATNLDLTDAYGRIPHNLIEYALKIYHYPSHIAKYINTFYSRLRAQVQTSEWITNPFRILIGLGQGDTLSQMIFIICFDIIIKYLHNKYKHYKAIGFKYKNVTINDNSDNFLKSIADDLSIITNNKTL